MENTAGLISRVMPGAIDDVIIDAIVLSACADGMSKEELEALEEMARALPSLAGMDDATVTDRIRESFARIERDGLEGRLKDLADESMDDETKRRVFCAAAIIQYADGHVSNEENEFLIDLADVLALNDTIVRGVIADIEKGLEGGSEAADEAKD